MQRKLGPTLILVAALLVVAPFIAQPVCSQQGAGVAGEGRTTRNGPANPRSRTPSLGSSDSPDDVSVPRLSSRRIREIESLEQQCFDEVNRVRQNRRLPRLIFSEALLPVARGYSRRMAEQHFFSHSDPEGRTVRDRVDEADIRWRIVGENLAYSNGYLNPVAASVSGWMESPGHRRNILEADYNMSAIGAWIGPDGTVYFTEIFIKQ